MTKQQYEELKKNATPSFPSYTGPGQTNCEECEVLEMTDGAPRFEGGNPYKNVGDEGATEGSANSIQIGGNHYKDKDLKCPNCGHSMQHWDISWLLSWDFFQYCITKYVFRWKYKGQGVRDLKKANHYLAKYIEFIEKRDKHPGGPAGGA